MKKYIVKAVALTVLVLMLACSLASCANSLGGTYVCADLGGVYTTYKFSRFGGELVVSYMGVPFVGTYEINGDKILITIHGETDEHTYSKDGDIIYIDDVAYVKE